MWAADVAMAKAVASELLKQLQQAAKPDVSEPKRSVPPPKPRPRPRGVPGSQEWYRSLPPPPRLEDEIAAGRAISMNAMIRAVPKAQPPRRPGHQRLQSNGYWTWWRVS